MERRFTPTFVTQWRKRAGASQEVMAEALGISVGHLSNVERGKRQYTQEFLEDACAFLRQWFPALTPADLLSVNPDAGGDPNDPGGGNSLIEVVGRIPVDQRDTAARMLRALAGPIEAANQEPLPARRRRRP
jgi:transcriptional regulator with XRE-family HTH domain